MVVFKRATEKDAERIAQMHALSWQQHYREAFSPHFLDNEVLEDRLTVWHHRFSHPKENQFCMIAEKKGELLGFLCCFFEESTSYGTYLDNLHVSTKAKGKGIGTRLMAKMVEEILDNNYKNGFYLWVLNTNVQAIGFYNSIGGISLESVEADDIGDRVFLKTQYVWRDMHEFLNLVGSKELGFRS